MQVTDEMVDAGLRITLSSVGLPAGECLHATDVREILTAALSDKQAGEVKIKPLEWSTNWGIVKAETPIGHYYIEARRDGGFDLRLEDVWSVWASGSKTAKAAAQADYERRVRSALFDVPAVEPVAWLVRDNDDEEFRVAFIEPDICWQKAPLYTTHAGRNALGKERG